MKISNLTILQRQPGRSFFPVTPCIPLHHNDLTEASSSSSIVLPHTILGLALLLLPREFQTSLP
jgi:hypothetical protein